MGDSAIYSGTEEFDKETNNLAFRVCSAMVAKSLYNIATKTFLPAPAAANVYTPLYRNPDEEDED
jgi:hypothetical protein